MNNLEARLAEIREREHKAVPGPWFVREPRSPDGNWVVENTYGLWIEVPEGENTARLIVLLRNNCLSLLSIVEVQAKALEFYAKKDWEKFSVIDTGKPHPNYDGNLFEIMECNEECQEFGETAREAMERVEELCGGKK